MSVRRFNGTSDELRCSIGGSNLTGAFTIAVLARPQAADEGTFISLWDATTERVAFGVNGSKQPRLKIGGTALSGAEIEVTPTTGQWGIWVVTKEAGTKAPRWHHYGFDTGVWKHANDGSTIGDPVTQAGGTVRFGNGTTLGFEQADLAAPAVWTKALSDAEVEALKSAVSIIGGWKPSASGLWLFKQSSVSEEVTDSTGNGANQSARTGTTALGEEPPISYEAKTVEGKAVGSGTGSGTAKGIRERLGKGEGSGTGSGTAAGTRSRSGKAAGSGTGSGEAKGTRTRLGKGDGSGTGTGTAAGTRTRLDQGAGSGTGSGEAKGTLTRQGKAAGTGTGSGTAHGSVIATQFTAAELKAATVLDSLIRSPTEELKGKEWHGIWAGTGDGTPAGWTQSEGEENATARWWSYGFPSPAFAGLTFAESLSEGQELKIVLMDDKLGNAVVLKIDWNNPEQYFYALYEQIGGEEVEPALASGFFPRVKGDRFYLSVEEGEGGVRAWRETGGGEPEVFAEGTLTEPLEAYGATVDLYLQGNGTFRGRDFAAVSLNPEPPIKPKPAGKMLVGINGAGWGAEAAFDIAAAAHLIRYDAELGVGALEDLQAAGLLIHCVFPGPYDEGGVSALDPDKWVADALAFYEANLTPAEAPIVEILNEPAGTWFWGEAAGSAANAIAYRTLIKKAYEAFHARYGDEAPKIIASVEGISSIKFGELWWEPPCAAYLDGVVVHPYGGNNPEERESSAEGRRELVEEARQLTGNSLPVYVSEVGWPTAVEEEPTGDSLQWTEAEQAANIANFFNWARSKKYIAEVVIFAYHDYDTKTWYGVVRLDDSHKPSYAAIRAAVFSSLRTRVDDEWKTTTRRVKIAGEFVEA